MGADRSGRCATLRSGAWLFFNGVLREYARLGRLLAHDGAWEERQIIPAQYMIDATTTRPADAYLAPGKAMPTFGYGYFFWLPPGALAEQFGQA